MLPTGFWFQNGPGLTTCSLDSFFLFWSIWGMVFRFACNIITLATNKLVSNFWDEKLRKMATFEDDLILDIPLIFKTNIIQHWDQESCCANGLNLNISAPQTEIFAKDPFSVDFLSFFAQLESQKSCPFPGLNHCRTLSKTKVFQTQLCLRIKARESPKLARRTPILSGVTWTKWSSDHFHWKCLVTNVRCQKTAWWDTWQHV